MPSQPSRSQSGPRRGSSRRSEGRSSSRYPAQRRTEGTAPKAPLSFFQRIKAIFTKSKPAAAPAAAAERNRSRSSEDEPVRNRSASSEGRSSRKPEAIEVTTPRLYVGNLSFDATESDLAELFNGVGQVVTAEVVSHKQTQRSKGFAFVQMHTTEEAQRAVQELHDKEFMGRKLVVSGAKNNDQHDARSEPRFAA
jgi:RNA recognition motif-containing protein